MKADNRLKIFTWHIHGSYLYYLSQGNFDIYVPFDQDRSQRYIGLGTTFPFKQNVIEVPVEMVRELTFDCILYQHKSNYLIDRFEILTPEQRSLPSIFVEHDPPQENPTDTRHVGEDPDLTIVHVTNFNQLMWDCGVSKTAVIDHGVLTPPNVQYKGTIPKGIVVINNLKERGRRLGYDIYLEIRKHVPLDLIGMDTEKIGGLGEVLHPKIPQFISNYRFFFNPIRYTSLGLSVLEAMSIGIPVVGLATTEMTTVIQNEKNGFISTDVNYLIHRMHDLLSDPELARSLGNEGKRSVLNRFNISRFVHDWERLFYDVTSHDADSRKHTSIKIELA